MNKKIEIFTDGGCRGNPGIGGWGAILRYKDSVKELSGTAIDTTNNQMELTAAIEALSALKDSCHVVFTTDSQYVKQGITTWMPDWKKRGWRTANKKPVKNQELWKMLDSLCQKHSIEWHWVRGHSGHLENERADELANLAMDKLTDVTQ